MKKSLLIKWVVGAALCCSGIAFACQAGNYASNVYFWYNQCTYGGKEFAPSSSSLPPPYQVTFSQSVTTDSNGKITACSSQPALGIGTYNTNPGHQPTLKLSGVVQQDLTVQPGSVVQGTFYDTNKGVQIPFYLPPNTNSNIVSYDVQPFYGIPSSSPMDQCQKFWESIESPTTVVSGSCQAIFDQSGATVEVLGIFARTKGEVESCQW